MKYDMHIRVTNAEKAATIIQLLDGEAVLIKMEEAGGLAPSHHRRAPTTYANGKRLKGITGTALIKRIVGDGKLHSREEIGKAFVSNGFAEKSAHAAISLLKTGGAITVDKEGAIRAAPPAKTR